MHSTRFSPLHVPFAEIIFLEEKRRKGAAQAPATMYPSLKVREEPDPSTLQEETTSLLLRVIESLSAEGSCSPIPDANPGNKLTIDSSVPRVRISKSGLSYSSVPSAINLSKGKYNKDVEEDNRPPVRASSVPRPRAVLSSPDNDGMIGNQNQQLSSDRKELPKRKSLSQNTPPLCKPGLRSVKMGSPRVNTRKTISREAIGNSNPKEKGGLKQEENASW